MPSRLRRKHHFIGYLNERPIAQQKFVDFRLAPSLNAATIIMQALKLAGSIDIAFAPELVVSEDHADELAKSIVTTSIQSRIIVAGSGPTRLQSVYKQSWNEARIWLKRTRFCSLYGSQQYCAGNEARPDCPCRMRYGNWPNNFHRAKAYSLSTVAQFRVVALAALPIFPSKASPALLSNIPDTQSR